MNFQSDGRTLTAHAVTSAAAIIGVSAPTVYALLSADGTGVGFLRDRRPTIRYERHVFHRLTGGQFDHSHPEISAAAPGGNPGGRHEYPRLRAALQLDPDAALMSTSWGIGEIMGAKFDPAGFCSAAAMVAAVRRGEDAQLYAMTACVVASGLAGALRERNWDAFAPRFWGGPYLTNGYAARMAAAYTRFSGVLPNLPLRNAQIALYYLGYRVGPLDGLLHPRTRATVAAYERSRGLPPTGDLRGLAAETAIAEAWP